MTDATQLTVRVTGDLDLAQEWELVLIAQGLSPSRRHTGHAIVLSVPEEEVGRALAALSAYEKENAPKPEERDETVSYGSLAAGVAVAALLRLFFFVTASWDPGLSWIERGSADAEKIIRGEVWRAVTALALHADVVHVVSNAVAAALFLGAVYGTLGAGVGSALVLLAGAGGNIINAFLQGYPHMSIGASTSVFGAVGILGGRAMARRRLQAARRPRAWLPVAAALALLALLGTEGERVDVLAHLFGFLVGGGLGILSAFFAPRPPGVSAQWVFGSAALALIVYCWNLALR